MSLCGSLVDLLELPVLESRPLSTASTSLELDLARCLSAPLPRTLSLHLFTLAPPQPRTKWTLKPLPRRSSPPLGACSTSKVEVGSPELWTAHDYVVAYEHAQRCPRLPTLRRHTLHAQIPLRMPISDLLPRPRRVPRRMPVERALPRSMTISVGSPVARFISVSTGRRSLSCTEVDRQHARTTRGQVSNSVMEERR